MRRLDDSDALFPSADMVLVIEEDLEDVAVSELSAERDAAVQLRSRLADKLRETVAD